MLQIVINNRFRRHECEDGGTTPVLPQVLQRYQNIERGFSMLEMIVTLAVLAVILTFTSSDLMSLSNVQKSFNNTVKQLEIELSTLHNEALSLGVTTRMVITSNNNSYTLNTYKGAASDQACSTAGAWTAIQSNKVLDVHSKYEVTGDAMDNICFDRNGTSSGGSFVVQPITANAELKTATITVTMATGYLDVDIQ